MLYYELVPSRNYGKETTYIMCHGLKSKLKTVKASDIEGYESIKGITRKELARSKNLLFTWNEVRSGAIIPPHSHPEEQASFILEGRLELKASGKTVVLGPGEAAYFEPREEHSGRPLDPRVVALDIHTPALKRIYRTADKPSSKRGSVGKRPSR